MNNLYLGIDTSCYTTSLCLVDDTGALVWEKRKVLEVPPGKRGLMQSNMVFQHTKNIPVLAEMIPKSLAFRNRIAAVTATVSPRREETSYMPAFLPGHSYGRTLASLLQVPLYEISHQENHIFAALQSFPEWIGQSFCAMHLSGGTTDVLYIQPAEKGLDIKQIGGSMDISAGQLIDRVGVALQLPFPAGPHAEALFSPEIPWREELLRFTVRAGYVSLAGPEAQLQRMIRQGSYSREEIVSYTFELLYRALKKMIKQTFLQTSLPCCIAVGGVMANHYLRNALADYVMQNGRQFKTAPIMYSSDNALGAAFYGYWKSTRG